MQAAVSPEPVQQVTNFDTFELPEWFKISFLDLSEDNLEAVESNKHLVVFFGKIFAGTVKIPSRKILPNDPFGRCLMNILMWLH